MNDDPCFHPSIHYSSMQDAVVCLDCFATWSAEPEPCLLPHYPYYCSLPHYPSQTPPWPQPWIITHTGTGPDLWKTTPAT